MVREIKKIEDEDNIRRNSTYFHRRHYLFKNAQELAEASGDQVAIIAFSSAGRLSTFGSPSVESVFHRYQTTERVPQAPLGEPVEEPSVPHAPPNEPIEVPSVPHALPNEPVEEPSVPHAPLPTNNQGESVMEPESADDLEELHRLEAVAEDIKKEVSEAIHVIKKL